MCPVLSGESREKYKGSAAAFKPSNIFKRPLQTCACKRNSLGELSKIEPLIGWTIPACNKIMIELLKVKIPGEMK